jgi:hypothetical protein
MSTYMSQSYTTTNFPCPFCIMFTMNGHMKCYCFSLTAFTAGDLFTYMRRLRMSSSFFATSPGVRSSSSAICFCLAGSKMLKHSQLVRRGQKARKEKGMASSNKNKGPLGKRKGGCGCVQVAINNVLDWHVIGAVHEMVAPYNAVRFLPHIPEEQ